LLRRPGKKYKSKNKLCTSGIDLFSLIRRKCIRFISNNTFNECAKESKQSDPERNIRAKTSYVQAALTYLASSGENVLYLLA
jgi:hypothetical protein